MKNNANTWEDWMINAFADLFGYGENDPTLKSNVYEYSDGYKIEFLMPGVKRENTEMSVDSDGNLVIEVKPCTEECETGKTLRTEFGVCPKGRRVFSIPDDVDKSKITANMENGILTVTLSKMRGEKPQTQRIAIG